MKKPHTDYSASNASWGNAVAQSADCIPTTQQPTLVYQLDVLRKILEELGEDFNATRALADNLIGAEPEDARCSPPNGPSSSLLSDLEQTISSISARVSTLRYQRSRLERAIRG